MSRLQQARKATKQALKARIALAAPAGGGKTYTALVMARVLADGGRILVIDTEKESASLYADLFDFDTIPWEPPFDPRELAAAVIEAGEKYAVVIVDSLSHFWMGEGGTLAVVDAAAARAKNNSYAGWKEGTPTQNDMIEGLLRSPAHVIATMRSKSEYVLEQGANGKSVPRRIGMAPVQRDGIEYEFTVTAELDYEHNIIIDKTRCHLLSGRMFPGAKAEEMTNVLNAWLNDGEPPADRSTVEKLVARMNALSEDERKSCKAAFVAAFGRPEQLLARSIADASALIERFETNTPPPPAADTTPESDGGGEPDVTAPAAPESPVAAENPTPPAPPPPASTPDRPTLSDRINALPADLAKLVRADQQKVLDDGAAPHSSAHVEAVEASLADAEKAQAKRARDIAIWLQGIDIKVDDDRHQAILTITGGAAASARKVTKDQHLAVKRAVRDHQNGVAILERRDDGTFVIREAVAS